MGRRMAVGSLVAGWAALLVVLAPLVVAGSRTASTGAGTSPRASSNPGAGDGIAIAWAGDITPGSRYGQPPDQARGLFRGVRELLAGADLTAGNLEGTLSVGGASKCGTDSSVK